MKATMRGILLTWAACGLLATSLAGAAAAADLKPRIAAASPGMSLPFSRGARAQSVWAADACARDCGAYCAWGQAQCFERDSQGQCLKLTDSCDRYCQRNCRTSGGPYLPLDF